MESLKKVKNDLMIFIFQFSILVCNQMKINLTLISPSAPLYKYNLEAIIHYINYGYTHSYNIKDAHLL